MFAQEKTQLTYTHTSSCQSPETGIKGVGYSSGIGQITAHGITPTVASWRAAAAVGTTTHATHDDDDGDVHIPTKKKNNEKITTPDTTDNFA